MGVAFMSCRFGGYSVLRLHMTHAFTSRTLFLVPQNTCFEVRPFSHRQCHVSIIICLVNRVVDDYISLDTPGNCSRQISVSRNSFRSSDVEVPFSFGKCRDYNTNQTIDTQVC